MSDATLSTENQSHTPAPWRFEAPDAIAVTAPDGGRVAICTNLKGPHGAHGRRNIDEVYANARLIAAAPELLYALKKAMEYVGKVRCTDITGDDPIFGFMDETTSLIAKVEGRS